MTIILNNYKTKNKYEQKRIEIPKKISDLIRKYVKKNKLDYGDYLFGNDRLSKFISDFNKAIGLDVTINDYRTMLVSPILNNPNVTVEERFKLSQKMGHSTSTSKTYQRKEKDS